MIIFPANGYEKNLTKDIQVSTNESHITRNGTLIRIPTIYIQ